MDLHDSDLDHLIGLAVEPRPVTAHQKQLAWNRIESKLLAAPVLPAATDTALHGDLFSRLFHDLWQCLRSFALEETRYESARRDRYAYRYYGFAPDSVSFGMEAVGPLRLARMSQVC